MKRLGWNINMIIRTKILRKTVEPELQKGGINLIQGKTIQEFKEKGGSIDSVVLSDGTVLKTNKVIVAVVVDPRTIHAKEAGLKFSNLGVITNTKLQTIDAKTGNVVDHIYAIGDCAAKLSLITKKPVHGEFGTNAVFQSKVAAKNIMGNPAIFPGVINACCSTVFKVSFGFAGINEKMAIAEGIEVVTGESKVLSEYPMMSKTKPIHTKLIFNKKTKELIGGNVIRHDFRIAGNIDLLSFAIQKHSTMKDLLIHQYCTHPELSAKPSDNWLVFATRNALKKL